MPVFVEESTSLRDTRVNPALASSLPRLTPRPKAKDGDETVEVVVVGSGPAGIMTSVCLARYGINSVLTVDAKPNQVHAGQADGLQPRTLEVLQSLDLAHEVLTQGCQMHEVGFWNPTKDNNGIERTAFVNDVSVPARYPHEVTIHQGRIERIMNEDLEKNGNSVQRGWTVQGFDFVEGEEEFPVRVKMSRTDGGKERIVLTKFLVGADGAHSVVRNGMGLKLEGEHRDHVWGVMDCVVKTTFPDIRKRCAIHSPAGSIMVIPRERVSNKQVLTRIYCQMEDDVEQDPEAASAPPDAPLSQDAKTKSKHRREKITLERIQSQVRRVFSPYAIEFGDVDWWAAYQIGQRATSAFSMAAPKDPSGLKRIHIAGDACHTHSPKAGQGMNVSCMDAFNLSWKLAHFLNGLAPASIMDTYEHERLDIARQLIEFDTKFSTMFSGKIGEEHGLTHEEFLEVFRTGGGFTSGCGIEYREGMLVDKTASGAVKDGQRELGLLFPGRRLMNVRTRRFCDENPRDIHDDIPTTGIYRVIVVLPRSFRINPKAHAATIQSYTEAVPDMFPSGVVEMVIIYPGKRQQGGQLLEWTDFPECLRERSEWLLLGDHYGTVYEIWGVDAEKGAVAVVRPDGYVGLVGRLEEEERVTGWLRSVLVQA